MGQREEETDLPLFPQRLATERPALPASCTRAARPERRSVTLRHVQKERTEKVEKHGSCGPRATRAATRDQTQVQGAVGVRTLPTTRGHGLDPCGGFQGEDKTGARTYQGVAKSSANCR